MSFIRLLLVTCNSIPDLPASLDDPLVGGQVIDAHRTAGVQLIGRNADFAPHAVFAAVREPGAGIDHDRR